MLKVGDYIAKKNKQVFGRDHDTCAALRISTITFKGNNQHHSVVNSMFNIQADHVDIITEEEFNRLNNIFSSLKISETGKPGQNSSHYRTIDGKEKLGYYSRDRALQILFHYHLTKPGEEYEAYLCDFCSRFHMGKLLKDEVI